MDIIIREAVADGKYVNIHRAKSRWYINVDLLGHCKEITFDASICTTVPTWTKEKCIGEGSGTIKLYMIPNGYMPEINIEGVIFKYMGPSNEWDLRFILVVADSRALYKAWSWHLKHRNDALPARIVRYVYHWIPEYSSWNQRGTYRDVDIESIVGLQDVYDSITKDINILLGRKDIIDALDMVPSCNYLLESRPGMGKTSLIRSLCTTYNLPMHVINANSMMRSDPEKLFSTTSNSGGTLSIYLFEDFDRYLEGSKEEQMASILNALDGVAEMPMSIRFFTANKPIQGERMEAFLSRIRRHIILDHHPAEAYNRSINTVFPSMDQVLKDHIKTLFIGADITMRVANQILCSAMVYDHPIEYIGKALQNCHITRAQKRIQAMEVEQTDDY